MQWKKLIPLLYFAVFEQTYPLAAFWLLKFEALQAGLSSVPP